MGAFEQTVREAIAGAPVLALLAAFAWGVLSVALSPCHLASIPLVVGYVGGQGRISIRRAFAISLILSLGIFASIILIGAVAATVGWIAGDWGVWLNYLLAAVLILVGLLLLEIIPMPFGGSGKIGIKRKGLFAALLMGFLLGVALGPCAMLFMAPVLGVALHVSGVKILYGIALVLAYGIGHCALIVLAGTFTELVQKYLNWNEKSRAALIFRKACGVLVILAGLYYLWTA